MMRPVYNAGRDFARGVPMATKWLIVASGLMAWLGAEVLLLTLQRT